MTALFIFLAIWLFPFVLCAIDAWRGTSYSCKIFGWHNGNGGEQSFNGCSFKGSCSKCGKNVLQDSQGNWFS